MSILGLIGLFSMLTAIIFITQLVGVVYDRDETKLDRSLLRLSAFLLAVHLFLSGVGILGGGVILLVERPQLVAVQILVNMLIKSIVIVISTSGIILILARRGDSDDGEQDNHTGGEDST